MGFAEVLNLEAGMLMCKAVDFLRLNALWFPLAFFAALRELFLISYRLYFRRSLFDSRNKKTRRDGRAFC